MLDLRLAVVGSNPGHGIAVFFWGSWPSLAGKLSWDVTTTQINLALHQFGVAKSSTTFGCGKGWKVISPGWQVTLCDPIWYVISHSGEVSLHTAFALSCLPFYLYINSKKHYAVGYSPPWLILEGAWVYMIHLYCRLIFPEMAYKLSLQQQACLLLNLLDREREREKLGR